MAGFGRAPKPESQQRRPGRGLANATTQLPSAGRQGDPPTWPLLRQSKREKVLWASHWAKPQAVMWERTQSFEEVAMYVRLLAGSEMKKPPMEALKERRQLADRLGLTDMARLRLRWEIVDVATEVEEQKVVELRSRIKAVDA